MKKRVLTLIGACTAIWVTAALPLWLLAGSGAVAVSAVAVALCLLPAVATLIWSGYAADPSPERQVAIALGGSGIRMIFVLGCGLVASLLSPLFKSEVFWISLAAAYLITLALEVTILVRSQTLAAPR